MGNCVIQPLRTLGVAGLLLLATPRSAYADLGNLAFGVGLGSVYPNIAGNVSATLEYGLADWLAGRLLLGAGLAGNTQPYGSAGLEGVAMLDALEVVPELIASVGVRGDGASTNLQAALGGGIRYFTSRREFVELAAGAQILTPTTDQHMWAAWLRVSYWWTM